MTHSCETLTASVTAAELLEEVLRRRAQVARVGGRRADERDDATLAAGNPLEEGLDAPRVADGGARGSRHRGEELEAWLFTAS